MAESSAAGERVETRASAALWSWEKSEGCSSSMSRRRTDTDLEGGEIGKDVGDLHHDQVSQGAARPVNSDLSDKSWIVVYS